MVHYVEQLHCMWRLFCLNSDRETVRPDSDFLTLLQMLGVNFGVESSKTLRARCSAGGF